MKVKVLLLLVPIIGLFQIGFGQIPTTQISSADEPKSGYLLGPGDEING